MKNTFLLSIMMVIIITTAFSQRKVEINNILTNNNKIEFKLKFANNIVIKTWDKNEVSCIVSVNINNNKNNDIYKLDVDNTDDAIVISSSYTDDSLLKNSLTDCENNKYFSEESTCINENYEISIPQNANLIITSISGNIDIDYFSGNVEVRTISGFVDVEFPAKLGADLNFKTISGAIYTDFDVNVTAPNTKKFLFDINSVGNLQGKINNGGQKIALNSISGNIYLRKKE